MEPEISYGFRSPRESTFPPLVQIAMMHYICNSNCTKCPVGLLRQGLIHPDDGDEYDPAKRTFFPFDLFCKVADEIAKHPWSILRLHGRGEPLLHPNYVEMIAYAKRAGVGTLTSFTNCISLNEQRSEDMLDAGIDLVEMSIDAFSEDLYRQFRGTEHFHRVVANAERFIKARNRRKGETRTRIIVSAVDCPDFAPEKESFLKFWGERADRVIIRPYHTYGGRLEPIKPLPANREMIPCVQLWTRFSISPTGLVNACFNDWADLETVGDLKEQGVTIASIWRNSEFEKIRAASLSGASILKCCGTCLASREGWLYPYEMLINQLFEEDPNFSFG